MKLRCISNSLRLRLTKSDIQQLDEQGEVQETLTIHPQQIFRFSLCLDPHLNEPNITFQVGNLQVALPEQKGKE